MMIRCAVFDFDGTLFDSMYVWDRAGESYLRSMGKEPKPSVGEAMKRMSLYQAACFFREDYGLTAPVAEIMAGINRTVEGFYFREVEPKPGAVLLLDRLRGMGIPMCIATATDRYQIEAALARCGMTRYFDAVFTCSEVGHGKDEPDIFRLAAAHFACERRNALIFEDSLHAVRTARADGFPVAAVFDKSEDRQDELRRLADCFIPDFAHTGDLWRFLSARRES